MKEPVRLDLTTPNGEPVADIALAADHEAIERAGRAIVDGWIGQVQATASSNGAGAEQASSSAGLTLSQYSTAKELPENFLRQLSVHEVKFKDGSTAVAMPVFNADGDECNVIYRFALDGSGRFKWSKGKKKMPYGLWHLPTAREAGYIVLPEGPSDTQTLLFHRVPALGVPGNDWNDDWSSFLDGIPTIYVILEPGGSGEGLLSSIAKSSIRDRVKLVRLYPFKDPSALHVADPEHFKERFAAALDAALPWVEHDRREREARAAALRQQCDALAREPRILDRLVEALHRRGVVGEDRAAKLVYLVKLSVALLPKAISAVLKAPSSAGKNFVTKNALDFCPPASYSALTSMSERALIYDDEPLAHRTLVLYEQAGLNGDFVTYAVRSLLSEGVLKYKTVEKTAEGLRTRTIEREGPTNLITTTTKIQIDTETETRVLSIPLNDAPEQTRLIMAAQGKEAAAVEQEVVDFTPWHALGDWLAEAEHRVVIPYGRPLASLIPPAAVRLRRDFPTLIGLIRTHAALHQMTRERDGSGRIVAALDDYRVIHELVADLFGEGVEVSVPPAVRETVEAVRACLVPTRVSPYEIEATANVSAVARHLHLDKSAGWRRVQAAIERGYLKNLEYRSHRPARLALDDPLPEEQVLLPSPDDPRLQGQVYPPGNSCNPATPRSNAQKSTGLQGCSQIAGDTRIPRNPVPIRTPVPHREPVPVQPPAPEGSSSIHRYQSKNPRTPVPSGPLDAPHAGDISRVA